ncbi:MAG: helix-turn-helix domain-containing protein, partial [Bacteroidales bacterium]|nr:helix-turn-helix domain-containing protein [Bacteroidales bacterium]
MSKETAQNSNKHLKITQAAKLLGISRSTLLRLEENGKISSHRLKNGYRIFEEQDILTLKKRLQEEKEQEENQKDDLTHEYDVKTNHAGVNTNIKATGIPQFKKNKVSTNFAPYSSQFLIKNTPKSTEKRFNFAGLVGNMIRLTMGLGMISSLIITISFLKINIPTYKDQIIKNTSKVYNNVYNKIDDKVLGYKKATKDFRYVFNVPILSKKNVFIDNTLDVVSKLSAYSDLQVDGKSYLNGGAYTTTLTFTDASTMYGLGNIDKTTENTLESILGLRGDVMAENLNEVKIAFGVIEGDNISNTFEFDGTFDLAGVFELDGIEVEASANDLNKLNDVSDKLDYLEDATAYAGGIVVGDGDGFVQDVDYLYWDLMNNRLGIGTNNPEELFSVNNNFTIDESGIVLLSDNSLLDLSSISHSDSSTQGLILPQNTTLSNISGGTEGYLAYDSSNDMVMVFDGNIWQEVAGTSTLQETYEGGNSIEMAASYGDLVIRNDSGQEMLFLDESSGNLGIGTTNATNKLSVSGSVHIDGNVGIGMTKPNSALVVNGEIVTTNLRMTNGATEGYLLTSDANGNGSWQDPAGYESPWTINGNLIYPDQTTNNVGIGTTGASYKLDVNGDIRIWPGKDLYIDGESLKSTALGNRSYSEDNFVADNESFTNSINSLDTALYDLETGASGLWIDGGNRIYADNYNNFVITDLGNIGIGTTEPTYDLQIVGSAAIDSITFDTNIISASNNDGLAIYDNASNGLFLRDGGNIGIGTTNPDTKLEVVGNITLSENLYLTDDNWVGIGSSAERISFDSDGNQVEILGASVGIGTTNPVYTLDV